MAHDLRPDRPAITPDLMLRAYAAGIFPMADARDAEEIYWVDPTKRGILPLDGFAMSRSLARTIRSGKFEVLTDGDFAGVVAGCAARSETWINAEIAALYQALFDAGHAHSVEARQDGVLVGGVYGVALGAAFFGESMFSATRDASKVALAYLVTRLKAGGYRLFDTQFLTPHLASLGGVEIARADYHALLGAALTGRAEFLRLPDPIPAQDVVQLRTQTS